MTTAIYSKIPQTPIDEHRIVNDVGKAWDATAKTSSASIAWITQQKPVRIAVHPRKMIPEHTAD
jgi:hypothetical protein